MSRFDRHQSRRRGMALLLVLMLITIMATTTATIAYATASRSLAAGGQVTQHQHQIAMEAALDIIQARYRTGVLRTELIEDGHIQGEIDFGGQQVAYRVWDEAIKIRIQPMSDLDQATVMPAGLEGVTLRPLDLEQASEGPLLFEDVFHVEIDDLDTFYGDVGESGTETVAAIDVLTLWGDGRLHKRVVAFFQSTWPPM